MMNSNKLFQAANKGITLQDSVSYKVFGLKALAEVSKRFEAGTTVYTCKLQYGGEVEIIKVENKWVDLQTDEVSPLAKSLGEGIETAEALQTC